MARPKKPVEGETFTVTKGNIAYDINGERKLEGDEIELPAEAVEALKDAGIIK